MMQRTIRLGAVLGLLGLIIFNLVVLHHILNANAEYHKLENDNKSPKRDVIKLDNVVKIDTRKIEDLKIPRIVHLTWKDQNIPNDNIKWVSRWKETNPKWEVWFWTDESSRKLVATKYPDLLHVYDAYKTPIFKADAMRYIVLYEYGGVWADLDIEPLKSLDPIREIYPSVLSQESEIHAKIGWWVPKMYCNAFMATRRHHPFFKFLVNMLEVNQKEPHPVASTGPMMVTRMYYAYNDLYDRLGTAKPWNRIHVASIQEFLPTTDTLALENLQKMCREKKLGADLVYLCDKYLGPHFKNVPTNESYTDHHWWHSWLSNKKYRAYTNIAKVLPAVVFPEKQGKF